MIRVIVDFEFKYYYYMIELEPIKSIAEQIADLYRHNLEPSKSSGKLSSFQTDVVIDNNHLRIIFNIESYWKYVEYGRKRGSFPPISAIEEWIRIKPIVPNPINNKIPTTKQLAYMISRKIERDGIEGKYPLKKTLESQTTQDLINAIKQEILSQIINNITKQ